ncbi:hypothetical protein L249_3129 [Ophiocordyceps polyrhachis-furcata BCC 54312]|uniref:Uncharacterized protein n=1 Tax=Ophiocordyceps polyrhachis-furcata BCC 54312 TaxID=1330021 RepID=A0A367LPU8_9HYPO|nr:hypothetical protein L249_3129 [Ophiocordyceps polyrhachis-furcata BCC 54312]
MQGTREIELQDHAIYPSLRGKTVLISGGAQGIGASAVELFCRQGSHVVFLDQAETEARVLCDRLREVESFSTPDFLFCDMTDLDQVALCARDTVERLGRVDVLVNNAGSAGRFTTAEVTAASFDEDVNVNLRHQFFLTQAVVPCMRRRGRGCIINLGSISWRIPSTGTPIYAAVKAAVVGLTRTHAREFGVDGIRVNSIMPGAIATRKQVETVLTDEYRAECMAGQCLKRVLLPGEVASLMLFLASDDAGAITGGSYVVDGGWVGDP